jgi:ferredoxin
MAKLTLWPSGESLEVNSKESLYKQLKTAGYDIKSTCGGCASCGQCVVKIVKGEENLQEAGFEELQLMGNVFHITKERLSCQTYANGDITLDISAHQTTPLEKPMKTSLRKKVDMDASEDAPKERKPKKIREGGKKRPKAFKFSE